MVAKRWDSPESPGSRTEDGGTLTEPAPEEEFEGAPETSLRATLDVQMVTGLQEAQTRARSSVRSRRPAPVSETPLASLGDFDSQCAPMASFLHQVRRVIDSKISVLLLGETGVGKTHLAEAIHNDSARWRRRFVVHACGATPETLEATELFGYERGAFTGAAGRSKGRFEQAKGGTLLLDEIGDLPLESQLKLLSAVECNTITRVGGDAPVAVDVRLIAATNRDLAAEVEAGRFRRDLFYRIAAYPVRVPPLREHLEDVKRLAQQFFEGFRREEKKEWIGAIHPAAIQRLKAHSWPGNVRELRHALQRAVILCEGEEILPEHLPSDLACAGPPCAPAAKPNGSIPSPTLPAHPVARPPGSNGNTASPLDEAIQQATLHMMHWSLQQTGGQIGQAAERLKRSRKWFARQMKELGLDRGDYLGDRGRVDRSL